MWYSLCSEVFRNIVFFIYNLGYVKYSEWDYLLDYLYEVHYSLLYIYSQCQFWGIEGELCYVYLAML